MGVDERKELVKEVIKDLLAAGFMVMPASMVEDLNQIHYANRMLKQKKLTPYQIAKNKLIPGVNSLETIKKMTEDGRIGPREFFVENRKMYITSNAIKRLRNESI